MRGMNDEDIDDKIEGESWKRKFWIFDDDVGDDDRDLGGGGEEEDMELNWLGMGL